MSATDVLQEKYAASMMLTYGVPPVALARGEGCTVWDVDGNSYLDLIGGIAVSALGHAHPALVAAVTAQVGRLAHTSNLFLHERQVELAVRLIRLLGVDGRVFLANSGTEANEAAIKLVRRSQGASRPVFTSATYRRPPLATSRSARSATASGSPFARSVHSPATWRASTS